MDVMLSMPILLFAIGIAAACGVDVTGCLGGTIKPGRLLVVLIIALFTWPYIGRIVRGNTLSIKEKEFIEAARSLGASNARIMFREVLPNLVAPIIVYATLIIPNNILFEAALSFLGVGVPQNTPSWGRILADAAAIFEVAWWLMLFPGIFLIMATLAFNLLGDGLRDAFDPRSDR
jgi:peptide/nickel transport system permease protein